MIFIKLIRGFSNFPSIAEGGVITIGNFDGVHTGHQDLLKRVVGRARELERPSIVITFEPHPFEFFSGAQQTIPRITRLREKILRFDQSSLDYALIVPFKQGLANLSASDFMKLLHQKIKPKEIIIGDDFRFGHKRAGDFTMLQEYAKRADFIVTKMPSFLLNGERVSSTLVRQALSEGKIARANSLLGYPFSLMGRIRTGDQRGREWGFPTANIYLHRKLTPIRGVYTVYMHGIGSKPLPGVANVGTRPTIDGTRTLLEVHLFDFNQDIYGQTVRVEFCEKLRDETRFANVDLLKAAIANDVVVARNYFKKLGVL